MALHEKKFELLCHLSKKDNSLQQLPFTSEVYTYTTSTGVTISPSSSVKDLGVIISADLSWQRHISNMVGNATKMAAWSLSLFQDRSKVTMLTLYKSMVRCRLEYCCPLWNPSDVASIQAIESVQQLHLGASGVVRGGEVRGIVHLGAVSALGTAVLVELSLQTDHDHHATYQTRTSESKVHE